MPRTYTQLVDEYAPSLGVWLNTGDTVTKDDDGVITAVNPATTDDAPAPADPVEEK